MEADTAVSIQYRILVSLSIQYGNTRQKASSRCRQGFCKLAHRATALSKAGGVVPGGGPRRWSQEVGPAPREMTRCPRVWDNWGEEGGRFWRADPEEGPG